MDVSEEELLDAQRAAIKDNCGNALKTYVWPSSSLEVPDDEELKLVILNVDDKETARKFMWMRGENKRSNINSVLVLYPSNTWHGLRSILRESIAIRKVSGQVQGSAAKQHQRVQRDTGKELLRHPVQPPKHVQQDVSSRQGRSATNESQHSYSVVRTLG